MKATVTKYEDLEVDIDDEQIEMLMCTLLKSDYHENKELIEPDLLEAMEVVYLAYSGKPIDYLDRFAK